MRSPIHIGSDKGFSRWRPGKPIQLRIRHTVHGDGDGLTMHRDLYSAGPWKVATDGRRAYTSGEFRVSGSRIRKKDGVRVDKRKRVKRTTGAARGKGAWTIAQSTMSTRAGQALTVEYRADLEAAARGR